MPRIRAESTVFLLILSATILMWLHQYNLLRPVADAAIAFISPLQSGVNTALNRVDDAFAGFQDARQWKQQFEDQKKLLDALQVENTQLKEKEKENEGLRALIGFRQANPTYQTIAAEVIGRDSNFPLLNYIIIDRGATDGITRTMPVVTARGLVGQVSEVNLKSSKVMLITDRLSAVNGRVQETRETGTIKGTSNGKVELQFVRQGEKLVKGHIVLTSGLGGRFPKNLVIGQIQDTRSRDADPFQAAELRPSVDFNALEHVLVIVGFPNEP